MSSRLVNQHPQINKNSKNETFKISGSVTKVFDGNHRDADTRIVFYALQQRVNTAVC